VPSSLIDFGVMQLSAGKHLLEFRVEQKNPDAAAYLLGIDCLVLRPSL